MAIERLRLLAVRGDLDQIENRRGSAIRSSPQTIKTAS
jgi:hypothetical protein